MSTWKSPEDVYHGTKWGYVIVAAGILLLLSLLSAAVYLTGQGLKAMGADGWNVLFYAGVVVLIIIILVIIALVCVKTGWLAMASLTAFFGHYVYGVLAWIWHIIYSIFANVYLLILTIIISVLLLYGVGFAFINDVQLSLSDPLVIAILIALFILLFPVVIFMIDIYSYEDE